MKQKRKFFVVADIHGFYDELIAALDAAGYDRDNPNHYFVSCGDALDRGSRARSVLKFLLELPKDRRIFIRGNHCDLLDDVFKKNRFDYYDESNGTVDTMAQLAYLSKYDVPQAIIREAWNNPAYKQYRSELRNFYETEHYVFVHGWIPCEVRVDLGQSVDGRRKLMNFYKFDENWRRGDWNSARWINGMEAWAQGVSLINVENKNKDIVCGHFHTSYAWANIAHVGTEFGEDAKFDPFIDRGIVALDACTARTHKINCFVCEEEVDETMEM